MADTQAPPIPGQRPSAAGPPPLEVRNPATGAVIATVATTAPEEIAALVARARAVQPAWAALGYARRGRVLRRAQRWVIDNGPRIARTIVAENGKAYEDALIAEVAYAANAFGFWAKHAPSYLADQRVRTASPFVFGRRLIVRYAPVGVVGVIGPWNYPLTNSFGDCIPALAAGNAVVLKPASLTPMTSLLMAEGLAECGFPTDVFQIVIGEGRAVGGELIDHVDAIMFTGSTEVGRTIMERAARTLTPVSLELGGKDPMIVLADADLERAANAAVYYSMQNGGQTCVSIERVYVESPVYDEFVSMLSERVNALRHGPPGGPGSVDVGAVTSQSQFEVIARHVEDAVARGARVLAGGHRGEGAGRFYEPTLLVDVDHSMACMTEETFGPTLPVMRVADADEGVRLANDSPYGLQSSVWTRDVARGRALANRIEAGVCCINDACINYVALELPMGGWKASGLGSRHGPDGIRKYTRKQSIAIAGRLVPRKELHFFPYGKFSTRLISGVVKVVWGRGRRR